MASAGGATRARLLTCPRVRLLAFSDVHRDLDQCRRLVEMAASADAVVAAGDFASQHEGLEETIDVLAAIDAPTVLVPGNNETDEALRAACAGWAAAVVLHGDVADVDGVTFFGLGAGVPVTPWDWSFDLSDDAAAAALTDCPDSAVLVVHSPPKGYLDGEGDTHLGSEAILATIESKRPRVAVFGHIHDCAGQEAKVGDTPVHNLGPAGTFIDV